jgi:4-alpha-glucanotransferase
MMLHRLYCIPHGLAATDGVYVRYPAEELWAAVCIESHRAQAIIVGENLGTVPPSVNRAMERHGARPLHVGLFSFTSDPSRPLRPPQDGAVASLSTHDTATFAGFWTGADIAERRRRGLLDADVARREREDRMTLRRTLRSFLRKRGITLRAGQTPGHVMLALLEDLGASDAGVVLVALEDLWMETEPQNRPGMIHRHNWRRRMRYALERIRTMPHAHNVLRRLAEARAESSQGGSE